MTRATWVRGLCFKFGSEAEGKNVTWSDGEYAHVGLQTQYLKLKSLHYSVKKRPPCRFTGRVWAPSEAASAR